MYEELIHALREQAKPCEDSGCFQTAEDMLKAADAIEQLEKDVERAKEWASFWEEESNEALKKFQVAVASKPRWIPVEERMPEKNTWVLAYCKYKGHVVDYVDINGLWSYGNVTHWLPLPVPPKEES